MLIQTKAIVLRKIKYAENSIIAHLYTEKKGLQSYIVQGIHRSKSKTGATLFQPLSLLDIVAYANEKEGLKKLKEAKFAYPYQDINQNIIKSCILLFLNEVINKSIKEEEANEQLFQFIWGNLILLDQSKEKIMDFHLLFLIKLATFLGFGADKKRSQNVQYFDLQEGIYTPNQPAHKNYITGYLANLWQLLQDCQWETLSSLNLSNKERNQLLAAIVNYYKLHLHGFGELKSLEVLKTIWH